MTDNEQKLLEGLRALAEDSPVEAPLHLEQKLVAEFRRRASARRWSAWGPVAAIAAGLFVVGSVSYLRPRVVPVQSPVAAELAMNEVGPDFLPVPGSEGLPAIENAMVVRMQLPVSSVQMMGFAVGGNTVEPLEADVLLGQDGLARAVRFVQ